MLQASRLLALFVGMMYEETNHESSTETMSRLLLVLLPFFFVPSRAFAEGKGQNHQVLEKAAKKACIMGDFAKGTDILGDLFVETNNPTYIFNQGRCFEQNHQWQEAMDRFREYLRKIPPGAATERDDANGHITECEQHLPRPTAALPPVDSVTVAPTSSTTVAESSLPPQHDSSPTIATVSDSGKGLRVAGIVVGAVGVVGLATGIVCNIKNESLVKELNQNPDPSKESTRQTYVTVGWLGYGVGAAALLTGATLYLLGRSSDHSGSPSTSMLIGPMVGRGEAALALSGSF